jgi:ATP-dependent Clp protease ATP-binding subunit ClpA
MEAIAQKYLTQLQQRMQTSGVQLVLPKELAKHLSSGCSAKDGARQMRRIVEQKVEGALSDFLISTGKKCTKIYGVVLGILLS